MNSSGKVGTVFIIIISILLISTTAISLFFLKNEVENRKEVEQLLKSSKEFVGRLSANLKVVERQNTLLGQKNKDADEQINSLYDELELEKGLREEIKTEALALKEKIDVETKKSQDLSKKLTVTTEDFQKKIEGIQQKLGNELNVEREFSKEMKARAQELEKRNSVLKAEVVQAREQVSQQVKALEEKKQASKSRPVEAKLESAINSSMALKISEYEQVSSAQARVELEPIIVISNKVANVVDEIQEGHILSIDCETEFVIVDLGEEDGIKEGLIMSIYRKKKYLGDIQVTRVQPEMFAADFISPFSSHNVRKNDLVLSHR